MDARHDRSVHHSPNNLGVVERAADVDTITSVTDRDDPEKAAYQFYSIESQSPEHLDELKRSLIVQDWTGPDDLDNHFNWPL